MNETGNVEHISAEAVPQILGMKPKAARRAWARWMADRILEGQTYVNAQWVRSAIEERILQDGHDEQARSQKKLEQRFATFCENPQFVQFRRG